MKNTLILTWKVSTLLLLGYIIVGGFLFRVPDLPLLEQTIRNIYFHVGMWFAMIFILLLGFVFSLMYLNTFNLKYDIMAYASVKTGLLFGILGIITGMIWANFTWGRIWINDPKLNGAAVGILVYLAYVVLRSSVDDADKRARLAAVYKIFAFVIMFVFIMILPRFATASIHPGVDGNPALATGDLDPSMQKIFFPAIVAWFSFSYWIYSVIFRYDNLKHRIKKINYKLL